jgi:hypothetical protein
VTLFAIWNISADAAALTLGAVAAATVAAVTAQARLRAQLEHDRLVRRSEDAVEFINGCEAHASGMLLKLVSVAADVGAVVQRRSQLTSSCDPADLARLLEDDDRLNMRMAAIASAAPDIEAQATDVIVDGAKLRARLSRTEHVPAAHQNFLAATDAFRNEMWQRVGALREGAPEVGPLDAVPMELALRAWLRAVESYKAQLHPPQQPGRFRLLLATVKRHRQGDHPVDG